MKLLNLLFLLMPSFLFAQNYKSIQGKVVDARTGEALAYVHVGMPNQGIGTVSNELGAFQFHFPVYFQDETIVFSHLGYEELLLSPTNIKEDTLLIKLKESANNLSTIEVMGTKEPLEFYLKKATENIENNYPTQFYALRAFYRELKINAGDETYTRLIEAAIDLEDKGYHKDQSTSVKLRIDELRKSDDHTNYTARHYTVDAKNNERNKIYDLFRINTVRTYLNKYSDNEDGLFGLGFLIREKYELSLKEINYVGKEKVYAIKYQGKYTRGVIHVSAVDYGIHRIEQELGWFGKSKKQMTAEEKDQRDRMRVKGKEAFSNIINFRKIKGTYYPSFIQQWVPDDIVYSKTSPEKNAFNYANRTLVVNDVFIDKKRYRKIKEGKLASRTVDLYRVKAKYHPEFWKYYNLLILKPIQQKPKSDLEAQRSLEEQFIANGN